ncbi:protein C19orf12 homolog [Octopus bimaculoides]|nr:protein C19orf12 homolog [Octopus bimaculoides]XP_014767583.1 protein C19orf12 homolog [Octopus bimaculoides]|eukprot:XP_014767582.1 PREDICTED: protein C19orf12 homolog [Octopus bimaculoides]
MVLSEQQVLRSVYTVCDHEKMAISTDNNLKGYIFTIVITLLGGFLFGPNGFIIGGVIGGYTAYTKSYTIKPASQVLPKMSEQEKQLLCQMYSKIFRGVSVITAATLLTMIKNNPSNYLEILYFIRFFITSKLKLRVN